MSTSDSEESVTESNTKKELNPLEQWLENIKEVGLTEQQADDILDEYITKGYWEKTYKIFKGRITVTMRTRDASHNQRIANTLDSLRTNDPAIHSQNIFRLNLAGSLVRYNKETFNHPKYTGKNSAEMETAFVERLAFIDNSLGELIVNQLFLVVENFDKITRAVFSNGAASAFLEQTLE